jgi:hypothetical protein
MIHIPWLFIGVLAGIASDLIWRRTGINKYERRIESLEHYHWGLVLLILLRFLLASSDAFISLVGTSVTLILSEITHEHPFALKSNHQFSSAAIGAILTVSTVLIWFNI